MRGTSTPRTVEGTIAVLSSASPGKYTIRKVNDPGCSIERQRLSNRTTRVVRSASSGRSPITSVAYLLNFCRNPGRVSPSSSPNFFRRR